MNYKVGDTVVCVDAVPTYQALPRLVRGKAYKVLAINGPQCVSVDEGCDTSGKCNVCGKVDSLWHRFPWRFIKLDGTDTSTEATKRNQQVIPEVL